MDVNFRNGIRGKHARALEQGYAVKVHRMDGTTEVQHFKLPDDTNKIMLNHEIVPLPESHRVELELRLDDLDANPDAGSSWEDVRTRLEGAGSSKA